MRRTILVGLIAVAAVGASQAVPPGFRIDVAPLVEGSVQPGAVARAALKVVLAEGFHVQSNQPRDPTLIATVLGVEPPAGVEALEVVFPKTVDFQQEGSAQPLAVFEREFLIGARFQIDPRQPPGDLVIPARLRYQACDDKVCFRPMTADVTCRNLNRTYQSIPIPPWSIEPMQRRLSRSMLRRKRRRAESEQHVR